MKTIWELPTYIENPGKADSLLRVQPWPSKLPQWGEVPSISEHYSEPVYSISFFLISGKLTSSVTALGMQLALSATVCSYPFDPYESR